MSDRPVDVAVYGIINAGKSSLINALAGRQERPTGPIGGTTVDVSGVVWRVVGAGGDDAGLASSPLPPGEGLGVRGVALEKGLETGFDEDRSTGDVPPPQPSPARGEGVREEGHSGSPASPLPLGEGPGVRGVASGSGRETGFDGDHSTGDAPHPGPLPGGEGGRPTCHTLRLLDTPGLEEVGDSARGPLATDAARRSDLVLFVLAEDLTATARRALSDLKSAGKPIVVALNKMDLLEPEEREAVLKAVSDGLAGLIPAEDIIPISAAPIVRRLVFLPAGGTRVETTRGEPEVEGLERRLLAVLAGSAGDLQALADVSGRVESHVEAREADRARLRALAEKVADETSAGLAIALAVNPVPLLDFLAGPGGLAILVRRVSEVYGEPLSAEVARSLAKELIRGGRAVLWGSLAATVGGGAMKLLPGLGHLAGALTQGASAGYFGHVVGRALVDYLDRGHDWGDGGLVAALDRIAATADRKAITKGLADRIRARLKGAR